MNRFIQVLIMTFAVTLLAGQVYSIELPTSTFDLELQKVRYQNTVGESLASFELDQYEDDFQVDGFTGSKPTGRKSPTKAFLLSFAIPGLGQYYNGSKLKAAAFLGLEVSGWVVNRKLDADGNDLQLKFEAFNRDHWNRARYDSLLGALGTTEGELGFSHHLPDSRTQQYYEMTGKYDQFSWGWTDARIEDSLDLADLIALNQLQVPIPSVPGTVPESAYRDTYEQMRYDSNQKFKSARRIASLIIVNHLVSGLEAFFAARSINNRAGEGKTRWGVKAGLKSYYAVQDTPYLQMSYKF